jgi:hypothetical protein
MSDPTTLRKLTDQNRRLGFVEALERPRTNYGSANPTGWPNNVPFFRTDLGWWIYYTGSVWVTAHEYEQNLTPYGRNAQPYAGGATSLLLAPARTDYDAFVTRVKVYLDIVGTNNGANYWSFTVRYASTSVYSFDTSADAAGVGLNKENAPNTGVSAGPALSTLDITGKTGAPSAVVVNCTIWYQLIVT